MKVTNINKFKNSLIPFEGSGNGGNWGMRQSLGVDLTLDSDMEGTLVSINGVNPSYYQASGEQSAEQAHNGLNSWKIIASDSSNSARIIPNDSSLNGKRLRYSMWVYIPSSNATCVSVSVKTYLDSTYGSDYTVSGVDSWIKLSYEFTNGFTPSTDRPFDIKLASATSGDVIYVDDIELKEVQIQDESGLCISENSRMMFDDGYKTVKDAYENSNSIMQDTGESGNLVKHYKREYKGDIINLTTYGFYSVGLTPDHKVMIVDKKDAVKYKNTRRQAKYNNREFKTAPLVKGWRPAKELVVGDYLVVPKVKHDGVLQYTKMPEANGYGKIRSKIYEHYLLGEDRDVVCKTYTEYKKETIYKYYKRWGIGEDLPKYPYSIYEDFLVDKDIAYILGWYTAEGSATIEKTSGTISVKFALNK